MIHRHQRILAFLCICAAMVAPTIAGAQDDTPTSLPAAEIDNLFALFERDGSPGASLAIVRNGKVIYKKGYGLANLEYGIKNSPSSIFHVASVSKEFTAMSIVLLARQGKLSLDDDIRKHLPEVPDLGETITIRHLIHHISGLRDQWELLSMAGWRSGDVKTQDDVLDLVKRQKALNFKPGSEYLYCNTGYTLLAFIVQRFSGSSLKDFAEENIFKPLGMDNTHFHDSIGHIVRNRTYSYSPDREDGYRINIPDYETYGATSLFTTVEDLAKWSANFEHARVGGSDAIAQMLERGSLNSGEKINYAFGLSHGTYRDRKTIGHGGSDAGYRAQFTMFPDEKVAIIVLSNVSNGNPGRLANRVADVMFGDQPQEPTRRGQQSGRRGSRRDRPQSYEGEVQTESFVGTYYSEELDVEYTIVDREGSLILSRRKFSDRPLNATGENAFRGGNWRIEFNRNANGLVTGMTITSGRVRNLRFTKRSN